MTEHHLTHHAVQLSNSTRLVAKQNKIAQIFHPILKGSCFFLSLAHRDCLSMERIKNDLID